MRSGSVVEEDHALLSPSTKLRYFPLVVARARGSKIWDAEGKEYIDFLSGAATVNIGHNHPRVVEAIKEQCDLFLHGCLIYAYYEKPVELARKLIEITPGRFPKKVEYGLSGSDAGDGAIKLARSYTGRPYLISYFNSYHGTTYGSLSLSGITIRLRKKLGPLIPGVHFVHYPNCYRCPFHLEHPACGLYCLGEFEQLFDTVLPPGEVAAVVMEPIQGDAGIIPPPDDYLPRLAELCRRHGILLVADEVQTGFGRSGRWFAVEHWGVEPDILVTAKALAAGMPLSAIVARREIMNSYEAPAHFFTTRANALSCVAALANIQVIEEERLWERASRLGEYAKRRFEEMAERHPLIGDVRGKGFMLGVDLVRDRKTKEPADVETLKVVRTCFERGLILIRFAKSVLRIAPPLVILQEELDRGLEILEEAIGKVERGEVPDEAIRGMTSW